MTLPLTGVDDALSISRSSSPRSFVLSGARPSLDRIPAAKERVGEPIRAEIDVDPIKMNLSTNQQGA
ncbi:MAG TPA: hypothetical protein VGG79_01365 [Roseiarcus sp.]|jgi:hypothetical protein